MKTSGKLFYTVHDAITCYSDTHTHTFKNFLNQSVNEKNG